ncbi:MAG: stage III sporulation protein AB [Bacteroidales bacterium]|nr:stage III sporulation protein AB [Lachnoclostridium sp.]MCM1385338.1 stage III sporulation protein AB [Lachnoclostridium sp.]MCM1465973.1 stage III sporulation protein AB [Bacteroidales bacterium]
MLRIVGGIMILSGCFGIGVWYRQQFRERAKLLRRMGEILDMLMSEIRYGKSTLPECCRQIGEQAGEPFGKCLIHIYEEMKKNTGAGFGQVFSKHMGQCLEQLPLTKSDKELFLRFAEKSSFADGAMQLKWMEQSREKLGQTVNVLERETEAKGRIAVGLGTMCGLLFILILL